MSIGEVTPLNVRTLAIWSRIGASIGLINGVVELTSGRWTDGNIVMLIPMIIGGAFTYNFFGLLSLLILAGTQYRFKFSEIRYPVWYWAIFPMVGIAIIFVSIFLSFIWGFVKSLD
jgi:hypothetical protein